MASSDAPDRLRGKFIPSIPSRNVEERDYYDHYRTVACHNVWQGFTCTRPEGHIHDHVGHTGPDIFVARWSQCGCEEGEGCEKCGGY